MQDLVITPNRGTSNNPTISFTGQSAGTISLNVLPAGNLNFAGNAGTLLNITDSSTFSVSTSGAFVTPGGSSNQWNQAYTYLTYLTANSGTGGSLSNYLPLSGGTITGNLNVNGSLGLGTTNPLGKLHVYDSGVTTLISKQITKYGNPDEGTYGGYLLLAQAYTSGLVNASWVNGTFTLKRGSTSSGNRTDTYEVASDTAYAGEDLYVRVTSNGGPFFTRTVKVTYSGVVYHAIETSVGGGNPDDGVWFNGSYSNCNPIYVDATYVSSVVAFGSSTITQTSNTGTMMYVGGTNGYVGIGTNAPTSLLDIFSSAAAANVLYIRNGTETLALGNNNTAGGSFVFENSSSALRFGTSSTERARIDASGNVGIGTTSPKTTVHIAGALNSNSPTAGAATSAGLFVANSDPGYGLLIGTGSNGSTWIQNQRVDGSATYYNINIQPNGGAVGIGTSSPGAALEVNGNVWIDNTLYDGANTAYYLKPSGTSNLSTVVHKTVSQSNYYAERTFQGQFPSGNGIANQVWKLVIGNTGIYGSIEVELTGTYNYANVDGYIRKRFITGFTGSNTVWYNFNSKLENEGNIAAQFTVGDLTWDSGSSVYYIPIYSYIAVDNAFIVKVSVQDYNGVATSFINGISLTGPATGTIPSQYSSAQHSFTTSYLGQVFYTGSVSSLVTTALFLASDGRAGFGTTSPRSASYIDVEYADPQIALHNTNDTTGGFIQNTYGQLKFGMYNPTGSTFGAIGANTQKTMLGMNYNGAVYTSGTTGSNGSAYNDGVRNYLDDGSGNSYTAGTIYDYANTGYYLKASSASVLNQLYLNNQRALILNYSNAGNNYITGNANGPAINLHPNSGLGGVANRWGALTWVDNSGNYGGNIWQWDESGYTYSTGNGRTTYGPNTSWNQYLQIGGNSIDGSYAQIAASNGNLHIESLNGSYGTYINYFRAGAIYLWGATYINSTIYDYANTGYYLKPSSTSVLNTLYINGYYYPSAASNSGGGSWIFGSIAWGGSVGGVDSVTGGQYVGGSGSQLYTLASGPGQVSFQVDGSLFAGDAATSWNPFGINGSSNGALSISSNAQIAGSLWVQGNMYAPIYYDGNDTGYYVDPNGTSNVNYLYAAGRISTGYDSGVTNSVSCSNWFRSVNNTGWYNSSYGGGIYMVDSTWVRTYNGKGFYNDGGVGIYTNQVLLGSTNPSDQVNGSTWYGIGQTSNLTGATGQNAVQLGGYGGIRMRSNTTIMDIDMSSTVNGYGNAWVYINNNLVTQGQMRSTIYYDVNNTGYYCYPSNTSNFNGAQANQFYVYGSYRRNSAGTGFLNGQYSGAENGSTTGPIYCIGDSWAPSSTSFGGMHGVGYCYGPGVGTNISYVQGWGFYVSSHGGNSVNIWMDSGTGRIVNRQDILFGGVAYAYSNTGYFLQPTSNSVLYSLNVNNVLFVNDNGGVNAYLYGNSNTSGAARGVQVYSTGGNGAMFSFHRGGYYAVNMGLDSDNVIRIGGWSASTNRWQLDMSGNMYAAGNITAYSSDERLKENIETIPDALGKIDKIRGVYFDWKDIVRDLGFNPGVVHDTGVIAQEIEEVVPEAVKPAPFDFGENGISISGKNYKTVQYEKIVPLLIQAVKELKDRVDNLENIKSGM